MRIMYVCDICEDNEPEACGSFNPASLRIAPDGACLCKNCHDEAQNTGEGHSYPAWDDLSPVPVFLPITPGRSLTFAEVTAANIARCNRWHNGGLEDWSIQDWAIAMAGEAGEVCNAIKKLRRIEDAIANISDPDRQLSTRQEAITAIGEEIADTFLYLNLLACRLDIDLPSAVIAKFNKTSQRYGFPERLPLAVQADG
jgi:NTP pyrophosphatase (non-canonical NTP hydrolase)